MDVHQVPADLVEAADLALAHECVEVEVKTSTTKCVCPTDEQIRTILAAVWDLILERGKVEECPYTFAHTRHWCGNQSCRDS